VEGLPPDGTYILFDLMGRQWLRGRVSEGSCRVDVSQLPPAAYVLAIYGRGYRQHCRVFVR
jgi:hypothetical protein